MASPVPTVYPWSNSSGLCRLLDDASLWKWFIADFRDNAKNVREDIKRVAKKVPSVRDLPEYRVLRVDDKNKFGHLFAALLASVEGRRQLQKLFDDRLRGDMFWPTLAKRVFHYARKQSGRVPEISETLCEEREEHKWFLVPAKLATWLAPKELSEQDLDPIAWFVVAFAILQPEDAPQFCRLLLDRDSRFLPLVSEEVASKAPHLTSETNALTDNGQSQTACDPSSIQSLPPAVAATPLSQAELLGLQGDDSQPTSEQSINGHFVKLVDFLDAGQELDLSRTLADIEAEITQLRRLEERCGTRAEAYEHEIHRYRHLQSTLQDRLKEVGTLPWLKQQQTLTLETDDLCRAHNLQEVLTKLSGVFTRNCG